MKRSSFVLLVVIVAVLVGSTTSVSAQGRRYQSGHDTINRSCAAVNLVVESTSSYYQNGPYVQTFYRVKAQRMGSDKEFKLVVGIWDAYGWQNLSQEAVNLYRPDAIVGISTFNSRPDLSSVNTRRGVNIGYVAVNDRGQMVWERAPGQDKNTKVNVVFRLMWCKITHGPDFGKVTFEWREPPYVY